MSNLVKTISSAPPLHQSDIQKLTCPRSYAAIAIDGLEPPPSIATDRGDDVHKVAAAYTSYCVHHQVPGDWYMFDQIAKIAGPEASEILDGVRENYVVDFTHVTGAEVKFMLDENFQPTDDERWAWYAGTRDVDVELETAEAEVIDWKSNLMPYPQAEVPNVQSDMYALAKMQENPMILRVKFRFRFVRYGKCERTADYTREDLPRLKSQMIAYRRLQLAIHADPDKAEAIPSKQCLYCPLLNNGCPIPEKVNPWGQPLLWERLRLAVYLSQAATQNNAILRDYVEATGTPLEYTDAKGDKYLFGPHESMRRVYPLLETVQALMKYRDLQMEAPTKKSGGVMIPDIAWMDRLCVKSTELNQVLKAKFRVDLDKELQENVVKTVSHVETGLHKAGDDEEGEAQ